MSEPCTHPPPTSSLLPTPYETNTHAIHISGSQYPVPVYTVLMCCTVAPVHDTRTFVYPLYPYPFLYIKVYS